MTSDSVVLIGSGVMPSRGVLTVHTHTQKLFQFSLSDALARFGRKKNSSMTSKAAAINADCQENWEKTSVLKKKNDCGQLLIM